MRLFIGLDKEIRLITKLVKQWQNESNKKGMSTKFVKKLYYKTVQRKQNKKA